MLILLNKKTSYCRAYKSVHVMDKNKIVSLQYFLKDIINFKIYL